jgi:hypothetical protein
VTTIIVNAVLMTYALLSDNSNTNITSHLNRKAIGFSLPARNWLFLATAMTAYLYLCGDTKEIVVDVRKRMAKKDDKSRTLSLSSSLGFEILPKTSLIAFTIQHKERNILLIGRCVLNQSALIH